MHPQRRPLCQRLAHGLTKLTAMSALRLRALATTFVHSSTTFIAALARAEDGSPDELAVALDLFEQIPPKRRRAILAVYAEMERDGRTSDKQQIDCAWSFAM